ncbi:hypothetical protein F2Q68_00037635 [Brassica cretica]|uniref:Uncharacterized protein n=1 Tax=Brassica cretica TaxID=69181 RepID=A0A8S9H218_BRACR|nr:hypothetical protein F2Q68_00037635 [Brassica cretica]
MVLIEQETLIKDELNLPSSSFPQIAATETKQVHDGDDSDGFETASEREEDDSINDAVTSQEEPPHQVELNLITEDGPNQLKEMGNSILGRFGMSIDNFNAVRDPNTGSYSLSFQN